MSIAQAGVGVAAGAAPEAAQPRKRGRTGYLLLLPGMLWLLIFFAVPTVQLIGTSLYDKNGSLDTGYSMTWSFGNYADALSAYVQPFLRSLYYSVSATVLAVLLGYSPTRSRSRPVAGRT